MTHDLNSLIRDWPGEAVITCFDAPAETWIFIALHSSRLGTPTGGTRVRSYDRPEDGLVDALRLAEGMTYKWAGIELRKGGGKAVLAVPPGLDGERREGLLRRYGQLVESLRGAFATGEDLGTTPEDMALIASQTQWVHGLSGGTMTDPGPFTARGVFHGIQAAVRVALGRDDLAGTRVVVQGVGDVGGPLCRLLAEAGAEVLASDVDEERLAALAGELGLETVAPGAVYTTPCDVFAPCAIGAVLDARHVEQLACRVVAGSANNQLATAADGERLHARGIVYAPDFLVNAGGALAFGLLAEGGREPAELMVEMPRIGRLVEETLAESAAEDVPPHVVAQRRAERFLETAEGRSSPLREKLVYREIS